LNSTFCSKKEHVWGWFADDDWGSTNAVTGHRHGDSGNDRIRQNNRNRRSNRGRHDDEEIPTALRSYRYDTNNNNPAETFDRATQEIAQYDATEVQGAGYMRRALLDLEQPTIQPPPKPKAPGDADDAFFDAELEVGKEEVKLVARRRMEQKNSILPSVYAVVWRQGTWDMKELLRSIDVFHAIDEESDVIALLRLIRASTVVDQQSQHHVLSALQAFNKFIS
jgi:hypothetical protein